MKLWMRFLLLGKHIIFFGGGYFRLFPYRNIRKWTSESSDYLMSYIHPRDLDPAQPMIGELNLLRRFKSYYGLGRAERKLRRWLTDFDFVDLQTAASSLDWNQVERVVL